ncbi:MAG: hypothetical protein JXA25_08605 [Anaerolineales bacterium]|nr:hypothetical protein [Anaerolineales bacterium]
MDTKHDADTTGLRQSSVLVFGIVMTALVFFLPFGYGLDLGPGPNCIRALAWEYIDAPWFSGVRFVSPGIFMESLLYTLPRFYFLYQIIRYYLGKTTRKTMILAGIVSAIFPALVSAVRIVGWLQGWTQPPPPISDHMFPIYIPIPMLLIVVSGWSSYLSFRHGKDGALPG